MEKRLCTQDNESTHLVQHCLRDDPAFMSSLDFGLFVVQSSRLGPSILIRNQAEINLMTSFAERRLDHRMALLVKNADIVLVRKRERMFEALSGRMSAAA